MIFLDSSCIYIFSQLLGQQRHQLSYVNYFPISAIWNITKPKTPKIVIPYTENAFEDRMIGFPSKILNDESIIEDRHTIQS